jgi:amino acid transporter
MAAPELKRSLTRFDVTCLGVNATIGSGIFALPDDLYRGMGGLSPLAFLLCAIGLVPVALCFAEAASRTERTGGAYVYAGEAFGPVAGYCVGWTCFANSVFSFAAVAAVASAYVCRLVGVEPGTFGLRLLAIVILVAFTALNYTGVKQGARAANLFTIAKILALFVLVAGAVPAVEPARFSAPMAEGFAGVQAAVFAALFALQGFEVAPIPAGETHVARRAVPIAVLTALGLSAVIYVLVQIVVVGAHAGLGVPTETPLADAALAVAPALGIVVIAGGAISTMGFVSGSALGTPRYLYAFASDAWLPRALAAVHPRFGTPHRAIAVTALLVAGFALAFDYRTLIGMSNVTVAVQYLATCLAVLVFRRRGGAAGDFRAPGGVWTPLVGAAVATSVFAAGSQEELAWAAGSLAAGGLFAVLSRRWTRPGPRA